jgi:pseudouridine-5'-phosphate glycosidase
MLPFDISPVVSEALSESQPVVALESAVITHGLPQPHNLQLAMDMERVVTEQGGVPATIAVLQGILRVGLTHKQLDYLAHGQGMHKISARDIAPAVTFRWSGGTTVASTILAALRADIRIFATGGIGGVHRSPNYDISADLPVLGTSPIVVVCSGAKSILDLDTTLEYLDTHSVPVVGYQTDEFPAFFSRSSGLKVSCRVERPEEVAELAHTHWQMGMKSAVLLVVPPPEVYALPLDEIEQAIRAALKEAEDRGIRGQAVTPYLLERVNRHSQGRSLEVNLALLKNNARIAGLVAKFLQRKQEGKS